MGEQLYRESPTARETFEEAADVLGFDIKKLIFNGSLPELTDTYNTQPAILTVSLAAFRVFMQESSVMPSVLAGHSLGEISALVASGAIQFRDGLRIVRQRGLFMREAGVSAPGAMAAIQGISSEKLDKKCKQLSEGNSIVVLSNINSLDQIVISGHKEKVREACEWVANEGGSAIPLNVSAAFHSPLMSQAAAELGQELEKYSYAEMKWPVLSNVTALPYRSSEEIIHNLTQQMISPVMWSNSMDYLKSINVEAAVEMEPKTVLSGLMRKSAPDILTFSFNGKGSFESFRDKLMERNKDNVTETRDTPRVIERCLAIAVCTRNRNWIDEEYKAGVVEPYRQIKLLQEEIESENRKPSYDDMAFALRMLKLIFASKKVPQVERAERYRQLFRETGTEGMFSIDSL